LTLPPPVIAVADGHGTATKPRPPQREIVANLRKGCGVPVDGDKIDTRLHNRPDGAVDLGNLGANR
jgi:hypothetical protein